MHLFHKGCEFEIPPLSLLGPEPLDDQFDMKEFATKLASTRRSIKSTLLDQTVVVGLGNIYVDESLFRARIHPERIGNPSLIQEVQRLYEQIVETLSEAVKKGGSTVRSYVNSQGKIGMFQFEHNVYGRKGEDCKICGTPLKRLLLVAVEQYIVQIVKTKNNLNKLLTLEGSFHILR